MIEGFYLYIHEQYEGFIYSNVIPKNNDVIDYNNKLYTVVTVKYKISKDEDKGDATDIKRIKCCEVYVII